MIRCLVVDDDRDIRFEVQDYLRGFGMQVEAAAEGVEMRRLMAERTFDVVVLDLMLPGEGGLSLCKWLLESTSAAVLMLTAQGDPASRVLGLELGADDYLAKPFEPRELVARIHAITRRARRGTRHTGAQRTVHFAGWRFDRVLRQLESPQQVVVALSAAEHRLLLAFVDHPRRVLSRAMLVERTAAPGVEVNDRSIDLAVSRLRGKLAQAVHALPLIRTVRGEGYLFDADVTG